MSKTLYAGAFAFNSDKSKVALIQKNRPAFLVGMYNVIGGHIEPEDTSYATAMSREFEEEAGVAIDPENWRYFGNLVSPKFEIYFYDIKLPDDVFVQIRTMEDEIVQIFDVELVKELPLAPHVDHFLGIALDNGTGSRHLHD